MRLYKEQHRFYAGVDLHARSLSTHILDDRGRTVFEKDLPAAPDDFLQAVKLFRKGLVVGCECMFAWYWLADLSLVDPRPPMRPDDRVVPERSRCGPGQSFPAH